MPFVLPKKSLSKEALLGVLRKRIRKTDDQLCVNKRRINKKLDIKKKVIIIQSL